MKININIEKKHLGIFALLVIGLSVVLLVSAANVDTSQGYHPLQQISKTTSNMVSVDDNGNGIIDTADNVNSAQSVVDNNCVWILVDWGSMSGGDERTVLCGSNEFITGINYSVSSGGYRYVSDIRCCS